jgi:hypothetical protein
MKLEIDLSEKIVTDCAQAAWHNAFASPDSYSRVEGVGRIVIVGVVSEFVKSPETIAAIRAAVKAEAAIIAPELVRDAVTTELRKLARRVVKEETDGQTLFKA